jgi:hypothetical protein
MEALEELQQLYKEQKAAILGQVESSVSKLAQLADTQAVRAMALRELYWNQDVSADLLAQVFGLTTHRMRKLAGALVIEKACEGNCGNTINKTYTSKSALAENRKWVKSSVILVLSKRSVQMQSGAPNGRSNKGNDIIT